MPPLAPLSPLGAFQRRRRPYAAPGYLNSLPWDIKLIVDGNTFSDSGFTTPVTTNGANISYIRDTSGNGRHCAPATATTAIPSPALPTLGTNLYNGKSALVCTGNNQGLQYPEIVQAGDFTHFYVYLAPTATSIGMLTGHSDSGATTNKIGRNTNSLFIRTGPTSTQVQSNTGWTGFNNTNSLMTIQRSGSAITAGLYTSTTDTTTAAQTSTQSNKWNIFGRAGDSSTQWWRGSIAAYLSISRVLTSTELAGVKSELGAMFAL